MPGSGERAMPRGTRGVWRPGSYPPPSWTAIRVLAAISLLVFGMTKGAVADVIASEWVAGDGAWSVPGNWAPAVAPNNTATDTFDVSVDNGATVTLDISVTVTNADFDPASPSLSNFVVGAGKAFTVTDTLLNSFTAGVTGAGTGTLAGGTILNFGTLFASGGGALSLTAKTVNNESRLGVIEALDGSIVQLEGVVQGGTLTTQGTGVVKSDGAIFQGAVANAGHLAVAGNFTTVVEGTLTNTGAVVAGGPSVSLQMGTISA
jgi:hypothetical protein